jgi:hypothetical protein
MTRTDDQSQMPDAPAAMEVSVDGQLWTRTFNLQKAGPDDRVFELTNDGRVVFGDGEHGAQPPAGSSVQVSYRAGGGAAGNSPIAVTIHWPPSRSRYMVDTDQRGIGLTKADNEVEQFDD